MRDNPSRGPAMAPAELDDQLQMAVLSHLLLAYPAQVTLDEVTTAIQNPLDAKRWESDAIRRAVRDLICGGLLHKHGEFVVPTQATARFWALAGLE